MASSSNVQWEVEHFELRTSTIDQRSDVLYANGRMQVPVIALIIAVDPTTQDHHMLTPSELDTIKLVDYHDPQKNLPSSWSCSSVQNEYDHAIPGHNASKHVRPSSTKITYQQKRYWVSTTELTARQIAATIRLPNRETVISDQSLRITLEGILPIRLGLDDLTTEIERIYEPEEDPVKLFRAQTNIYVSSKVHALRSNTIVGTGAGVSTGLKYCFYYEHGTTISDMYYCVAPLNERVMPVGKDDWIITFIRINQKSNAMCLSFLATARRIPDNERRGWSGEFLLFDRYGNQSKFYARVGKDGEDLMVIDTKEAQLSST